MRSDRLLATNLIVGAPQQSAVSIGLEASYPFAWSLGLAGTVQRAFSLAPKCTTIDEIRSKLKHEGFESVQEHLQGASIQRQLKLILATKLAA